jgi:integrase
VGTFSYMSPEQVEGKEADGRSDIFALGALMYEMATGKRAFEGKMIASVIAAVMTSQVQPISAIQPLSTPTLDRIVRTCLAKDPDRRFQNVHDVNLQLTWIGEERSQAGVPAQVSLRKESRDGIAWFVAICAILAILVLWLVHFATLRPKLSLCGSPSPRPTTPASPFCRPMVDRCFLQMVAGLRSSHSQADPFKRQAATLFSVFAARWQEDVLIHKKASTSASMKSHISTLLTPEFGKLAMGDVDSERVQAFLNRISGKLSPKSVKNVWTTLRVMLNSAMAWKYIEGELRVELPKARKLRMRCYSVDDVKRILANTHEDEQLFFWLAAETGARVGELIALRVSDVHLDSLFVEINKALWGGEEGAPKTEAGNRCVCLSSHLGAALKKYVVGRKDGFLFRRKSVGRKQRSLSKAEQGTFASGNPEDGPEVRIPVKSIRAPA